MPKLTDPLIRFTAKVNEDGPIPSFAPHLGPCWIWIGATHPKGYGRFMFFKGKVGQAHRWSYEHYVGPIPDGLDIDHLCRVRNCVNPEHLEPVTNLENHIRAGLAVTECKFGHEYTPENTYRRPGRSSKECRACIKERPTRRTS
jgi:hypothetical protein